MKKLLYTAYASLFVATLSFGDVADTKPMYISSYETSSLDYIKPTSYTALQNQVNTNFNFKTWWDTPNRWKYKPASFLGIDFRRSVIATALVDTYQTSKFKRLGIFELNPAAELCLNAGGNWLYVPAAVLSIVGFDSLLQKASDKDKVWMYIAWFAIETVAVLNNRRLGTGGIPVIIPMISIRF